MKAKDILKDLLDDLEVELTLDGIERLLRATALLQTELEKCLPKKIAKSNRLYSLWCDEAKDAHNNAIDDCRHRLREFMGIKEED